MLMLTTIMSIWYKKLERFINLCSGSINHGFIRRRGGENDDDANGTRDNAQDIYDAAFPKDLYMMRENMSLVLKGEKQQENSIYENVEKLIHVSLT
jgi:hypothetical protein